MRKLVELAIDGWFPKVGPTGRYTLCGASSVNVVDNTTGAVVYTGSGYPAGWVDSVTIYFTEDAGSPDERVYRRHWTRNVVTGATAMVRDWTPTGSSVVVAGGLVYWATTTGFYCNGRVMAQGEFLPQSVTGSAASQYVVATQRVGHEDYVTLVARNGGLVRWHRPQTDYAHRWVPAENGWVTYGYFGPCRMVRADAVEHDITITPWRREGPAVLLSGPTGSIWAWSATERPDGRLCVVGWVLGHPDVVEVEDFPAVAPSVVCAPGGNFVVAGNSDAGVLRVWSIPADTPRRRLEMPSAPPPVWHPPGTMVPDTLPFITPPDDEPNWLAQDGQTYRLVRTGPDELTIVKWDDPYATEILRWDAVNVLLAYDRTDGRAQPWRLEPNVWMRRSWAVGDEVRFPDGRLIRRQSDGTGRAETFPYAVRLDAYGEHIDLGGDLGVVDAVIIVAFVPHVGRTHDGYTERHWYPLKRGRRVGMIYEEWRSGELARRFDFVRRTSGSVRPNPPLPIPDPVPNPTPEPEEPPVVSFPPRNESLAFFERLEQRYAAMGREPRQTSIDAEGVAVWMQEYLRHRVNGANHEQATASVLAAIDAVVNPANPS